MPHLFLQETKSTNREQASDLPVSLVPITIAIVGAGFSGTLVATHLLKTANRPLKIKLIECTHKIGTGVAYSTAVPGHLLNISAGKMSAFAADPGHFLRWLNYNQTELGQSLPADLDASSFIPRSVYGLYLQSILAEAEATASRQVYLERIHDQVVAVTPTSGGALVTLKSGGNFTAEKIVLALGNGAAQPSDSGLGESQHFQFIRPAWSAEVFADLEPEAPVLLLGTGLTMVDMVVNLIHREHRGKIYAVSRRGLMPNGHAASQPYPAFLTPQNAPKQVLALLQLLRQQIEIAHQQGYDWRAVIDALRPISQQLWQGLPQTEQARFLRHLSPYWDVHRHHIAPEIDNSVQERLRTGQLQILAGRIQSYQTTPELLTVEIKQRHRPERLSLQVARIINCTGVPLDYRQAMQPLVENLCHQGLVSPNPIGLGLSTTEDGALLDQQGQPSNLLYTLGTPRKGDLWETTAVPELREQAQNLALYVLQSLPLQVRPVVPYVKNSYGSHRSSQPALNGWSYPEAGEVRPQFLQEKLLLQENLLFRQFFDPISSSYTYLVADRRTKEAIFVDPVLEQVERDLQVLEDLGLTLRYCLETHLHADHITGAGKLRKKTGCQILVPQYATAHSADRTVSGYEILIIGSVQIEALPTPGHTNFHLAYYINNTYLLSGDALLIRGCGRTDLQSGDAGTLYDSVTQILFNLPDRTLVYPSHDYQGRTVSTIGEEKRLNPRFANRSRKQFITIMQHLGLSNPQKMEQAIFANAYCGDYIPGADTPKESGHQEHSKVKQTLSSNIEIYETYFAMYI